MGGKIPDRVKKLARARGIHVFSVGDPAILLYEHKGKTYQKLVEITKASWGGPVTTGGRPGYRDPELIEYEVRSEQGGVLGVCALSLRPGNILDRISTALELD